ncbi:MAG: CDF family Co(II)/Ni(II) efflux transporter DmeF [Enterobacterales bacterium]|nr:CDF family Co(II)/Ni(II) efflux transporter DmeF [Enterobacterales bacterium]
MKNKQIIDWDHSHNFGINNQASKNKVKIVFWLTTVIMLLEITAGIWSGSMALLADGWHMGTHSAAFLITMFAYAYSTKHKENRDFSFGTGKVNYLGGFASAIALAIVALMMVIESIARLIEPQAIYFNEAILVAIIGLIVNLVSVFILDDHHHHHHAEQHSHHESNQQYGHKHHDHNLKAAYFHVLADTLTSVLAIVALLSGKYFGWVWMDAIMGIVGALVIARWSFGLIKESSSVLLDKATDQSSYLDLAGSLEKKNGAIVKDLHIWKISESHKAAILSVETNTTLSVEGYKQTLLQVIPHLSHISIQVNKP